MGLVMNQGKVLLLIISCLLAGFGGYLVLSYPLISVVLVYIAGWMAGFGSASEIYNLWKE